MPKNTSLSESVNKFVTYLVSAVFISVTLWLGYSVSEMSKEMARFSTNMGHQIQTMKETQNTQKELTKIIADMHEKDMELTYNIKEIQQRLDKLEE